MIYEHDLRGVHVAYRRRGESLSRGEGTASLPAAAVRLFRSLLIVRAFYLAPGHLFADVTS